MSCLETRLWFYFLATSYIDTGIEAIHFGQVGSRMTMIRAMLAGWTCLAASVLAPTNTPAGICGNDDCGQTSAWYVFSALGFYPVCPGDDNYLIGTPLFDRTTLTTGQGKTFVINALNNGPLKPYINGATLNGESFNRTYLNHDELLHGGELNFHMTSAPNYKWAIEPDSRPRSALAKLDEELAK